MGHCSRHTLLGRAQWSCHLNELQNSVPFTITTLGHGQLLGRMSELGNSTHRDPRLQIKLNAGLLPPPSHYAKRVCSSKVVGMSSMFLSRSSCHYSQGKIRTDGTTRQIARHPHPKCDTFHRAHTSPHASRPPSPARPCWATPSSPEVDDTGNFWVIGARHTI